MSRNARQVKHMARDRFADFLAALPGPLYRLVFGRFRRYALWWLFRAYGREVTLAPAGPAGNRFYMRLHPMADSAFVVGEYEPGCVRALREHLPEGSVCVDVGANVGYFSILMSQIVGKQGQTIAFEPMPETVEVLRENIEVNHLENVIVVAAAASDESGSVEILSDATDRATKTASMVGYHVEGPAQKTIVRCIRLDDYFDGSMRLPSLIKIDVEGAELMALKGAREIIARANPVLIIEIHGWGSPRSQEVLNLLGDFRYRAKVVEVRSREAFCVATPLRNANA
jgi:FkbM family methyltransferase